MKEFNGTIQRTYKFLYGPVHKSNGQIKYKFIYGYGYKKITSEHQENELVFWYRKIRSLPECMRLVFWYRKLYKEKITKLSKDVTRVIDSKREENTLKNICNDITIEDLNVLKHILSKKYIVNTEEFEIRMLTLKRLNELYTSLCMHGLTIERVLDLIIEETETFKKCMIENDSSLEDIILTQAIKEKALSIGNDSILKKLSNTILRLDDITLKKIIIETIIEREVQLYNPSEEIEVVKSLIMGKIKIGNIQLKDVKLRREDIVDGDTIDEVINFYKIVVRDILREEIENKLERNIEGNYDGTDKNMIQISFPIEKFKKEDYEVDVFDIVAKMVRMDYEMFEFDEIYQLKKQHNKKLIKADEVSQLKRNILHYFLRSDINMLTRVIEHELINDDVIDMFDKMAKDLLEDGFNIAGLEKIHNKKILKENNDNRFKIIINRLLLNIDEISKIKNITIREFINDKDKEVLAEIITYRALFKEVEVILKEKVPTVEVTNDVPVTKKEIGAIISIIEMFNNTYRPLHVTDEQIQGFHDIAVQIDDDRELKLYTRFWIINNTDYKDLLILPDHDFPYEQEPIFEGGDERSENWDVVYPNKFYEEIDRHPIPNGKYLAMDEIEVDINIMIEIINIFIMMWCKFTPAFWGWTGVQAVCGITDSIYEFLTLDTTINKMQENDVLEQYQRAYKWLRWEAEKTALLARHDSELRGNYYVDILLTNLINYMVDHHFDVMPLFRDVNKMDEWRTLFNTDINKDITWVLDKLKGIRHKILKEE